ncbi:MAG: TIGR02453 family protein [Gammaproteobacteria bacterium]|nr:TIGR02453 family protein [Gammaproteobacteria bacterium]
MNTSFEGFSPKLFQFLRDLKNNNKAWFEQNRDRYQQDVVEPMVAFIAAMVEPMREVSPYFQVVAKAHGGSMFRIYRDTRFAKDKRPYKENVGCQFRHEVGKDAHAPGFYVHLEPDNIFFGGGIWMPPTPVLNKVRMVIQAFPKSWEQVVENPDFKLRTHGVEGDGLIKVPRGFAEDHPFITDIKRKSYYAMGQATECEACQPEFVSQVAATFEAVAPLMKFLCRALEVRF